MQTNPDWAIFYKMTGQYSSKVTDIKNKRLKKIKDWRSGIKESWVAYQLNAVYDPKTESLSTERSLVVKFKTLKKLSRLLVSLELKSVPWSWKLYLLMLPVSTWGIWLTAAWEPFVLLVGFYKSELICHMPRKLYYIPISDGYIKQTLGFILQELIV